MRVCGAARAGQSRRFRPVRLQRVCGVRPRCLCKRRVWIVCKPLRSWALRVNHEGWASAFRGWVAPLSAAALLPAIPSHRSVLRSVPRAPRVRGRGRGLVTPSRPAALFPRGVRLLRPGRAPNRRAAAAAPRSVGRSPDLSRPASPAAPDSRGRPRRGVLRADPRGQGPGRVTVAEVRRRSRGEKLSHLVGQIA